MKFVNNFRWVGMLLTIGAVSAVLTSVLEDITGTDRACQKYSLFSGSFAIHLGWSG